MTMQGLPLGSEPPAAQAWAYRQGYRRVAGVDEAGRGAMAGPVVAAAVILPCEAELSLAGDSKQLTPQQREAAYEEIRASAVAWAVGVVGAEIVDRINVLRASHLGMAQALAGLSPEADFALVDGLEPGGIGVRHLALVKGDALSPLIGAASVIAKVTRDRIMQRLDLLYPGYGLARHKGYCTKAHVRALEERGASVIHRRSFAAVAAQCMPHLAV